MSVTLLKPNYRFRDQIKVLAIIGYEHVGQIDEADLYPVARAWLLENVNMADKEDLKTRAAPYIWTRSVCAQVLQWAEFNRDCNQALFALKHRSPMALAAELWLGRGARPPKPAGGQGGQVIVFPHTDGTVGYAGGPAA